MDVRIKKYTSYLKYFEEMKSRLNESRLSQFDPKDIEEELYWFECNPWDSKYLLGVKEQLDINKARAKNSPNSIVVYALEISDEPPSGKFKKKYGSLPDVDFDSSCKDKIKDYWVKKYGINHVCLIGTKGTLQISSAIKAAMRLIHPDAPFEEVNIATKKFQEWESLILKEILDTEGEDAVKLVTKEDILKDIIERDEWVKGFFEKYEGILEEINYMIGLAVLRGVHAAGMCISSEKPIWEVCPVRWDKSHGMFISMPEMKDVEMSGLIKYDNLSLVTLDIIRDTRRELKRKYNLDFDKSKIDFYDKEVYKKFIPPYCENEGVFQFKTPTAHSGLSRVKNQNALTGPEGISALTATLRPGPMKGGLLDLLISVMNGDSKPQYAIPQLEPILQASYGQLIYQEQIQAILREIGNFNEGDNATFIKAVSKKEPEVMAKYKEKYLSGVRENKVSEKLALNVWDLILKFGGYGFNKAHSISYAMTGYVCQYLKYYYKIEFIAASLPKLKDEEFRRFYPAWQDIILPPNVNHSNATESSVVNDKIYLSLNSVKGMGAESKKIESLKPFKNLQDFLNKSIKSKVNSRAMYSLVLSGGVDSLREDSLSDPFDFRKKVLRDLVSLENGVEPLTMEEIESGITIDSKKGKLTKSLEKDLSKLSVIESAPRIWMLLKQISLLKVSTCDYHSFLSPKKQDIEKAARAPLKLVSDLYSFKGTNDPICIIGFVKEARTFKVKKKGKNYGRDMARISIDQKGVEITVLVMPDNLEMKGAKEMVDILKFSYPLIVAGKVGDGDGITIFADRIIVPSLKDIKELETSKFLK